MYIYIYIYIIYIPFPWQGMTSSIPNCVINGSMEARYQGNLNISFSYVEGESLLMALKDMAISSGSACTSASLEPSYVLRALVSVSTPKRNFYYL